MMLAPPRPRPAGSSSHPPRRHRRRRHWWRIPCAVLAIALLAVSISIIGAFQTPGNEAFQAKWADWLRSHHAAIFVNHMEAFYYTHQAPTKGGQPANLNPVPPSGVGPVAKTPTAPRAPSPVPLLVSPALAGEGQWRPTGPNVGGGPAMYIAQFRADSIYTGQITTAVWMDPTRLHIGLVPGSTEPGGKWPEPPFIPAGAQSTVLAAFNGGFRFQDAHGGFYLDGRQAVPLRANAASVVLYRDGHVDIVGWTQPAGAVDPRIAGVLQNLVLLVDNGQLAPAASQNDAHIWGNTLGARTIVARSGIGVTKNGDLIYVAGPALSVKTLAEALQRAGAVRAMTLDLNPEWVTFNLFQPLPVKLYPQMQRPATRYLGPTSESRDFFTVTLPGSPG